MTTMVMILMQMKLELVDTRLNSVRL